MGEDGEMIGVIIPPPENLDDTANLRGAFDNEVDVVQEVDDMHSGPCQKIRHLGVLDVAFLHYVQRN